MNEYNYLPGVKETYEVDLWIQWTPSNPATLETNQSVPIRGVDLFQGGACIEYVLQILFWDFLKWSEYKGGHISGVQIRGGSL